MWAICEEVIGHIPVIYQYEKAHSSLAEKQFNQLNQPLWAICEEVIGHIPVICRYEKANSSLAEKQFNEMMRVFGPGF